MTTELTPELAATIEAAFARRDRENMQPTIDFFEDLLREHPENPYVLYEVGGSYDTDGQEAKAVGFYERALPGLSGEIRRKCLLQYGSTLRNLGRLDESLDVFKRPARSSRSRTRCGSSRR
ncbi:tetratricopeptide repeat protein [Kribbella sp. NPDC020789]